jgi:hypothetical protein
MKPKELFRTQDGSVFEDLGEANACSVEEAASTLTGLMWGCTDLFDKSGGTLIANSKEILDFASQLDENFSTLKQALEGKLITKYKLVK